MKINKLFFVFALLVVFSCKSKDEEVLIGDWARKGDFDGAPRNGATCFVIDNKTAYIGLGYTDKDREGRGDFYTWDGVGGWNPVNINSEISTKISRYYATSFVIDTKVYIGLGLKGSKNIQSDFWEFNTLNGSWRQVASLKLVDENGNATYFPRYGSAGIGFKGKGYVVGGYDDREFYKDTWEFTPPTSATDSGSWKKVETYDGSKRANASLFEVNNRIYLFGGKGSTSPSTDFHYFENGKWTKLREIRNANTTETFDDDYGNLARQNASVFIIDNKVYVTLGDGGGGSNNTTFEYHPDTDLWYKKTQFEGYSRTQGVGFSIGNRGFVGTGVTGTQRLDDIWEFFPWRDRDDTNNY